MSTLWDNPATARRRAADERLGAAIGPPSGLLARYRAYDASPTFKRMRATCTTAVVDVETLLR